MSVFVLDRQGVAVMPCTQKRARLLLARGRARVHRLVPFVIRLVEKATLQIKSTGRGSYQRTRMDAFGFPRGYLMREKSAKGFATGDLVKATVTHGKKQGCYRGRVAIRATGSFNIQTREGVVQGISHRHCTCCNAVMGMGINSRANQTQEEIVLRTMRSASQRLKAGGFPRDSR